MTSPIGAVPPKKPLVEPCPNQGRYGYSSHLKIDGRCGVCDGEEAARRARLEEKGIFLNG